MPPEALAKAELAIMALLWDQDALTARQLQDNLYGTSDRSQHGTIQRLLQRLLEKGFVRREKFTAAATFRASITRDEYASAQLESLAERLTGGSIAPLLSHLVDNGRLSTAELQRLRDLLDGGQS